MSRQKRLQFSDALYHVTSRGNAKQPIFFKDKDRLCYLDMLEEVASNFNWIIYSYCLMNNHYHLLLETPDPNLSEGMKRLNSIYSQWFNHEYRRVGHVMQGRFHSPLVETDRHLIALSAYIVLNPVKAKMVKHPGEWRWSSYLATVGRTAAPLFLDASKILELFSPERQPAEKRYEQFVSTFAEDGKLEVVKKKTGCALRPTLGELFKDKTDRELQMHKARTDYGYRISEIADYLGLSDSKVSRTITEYSRRIQIDEEIRQLFR